MIRLAEEELGDGPIQDQLRKQLLETALGYYQEFVTTRNDQPESQAELAVTQDRVKKILADLAVLKADRQNFLLREPAVLDDLQVTADQRTKLIEMHEQHETRRQESPRPPFEGNLHEHHQRSLAIARENEAALAGILTGDQLKRLPQIALQWQGPRVLLDPDVVAALKLSVDQRNQLRIIEYEAMAHHFQNGPRRGPPDKHDDRAKLAMTNMLAVLTPEQQAQWQAMIGKPYGGPTFPHRQGFGGGPPGRFDPEGNFGPPGRKDPGARKDPGRRESGERDFGPRPDGPRREFPDRGEPKFPPPEVDR
jgi:hypothetical protein